LLQVRNITKSYHTGDFTQIALNDVSLSFRETEFVSILGPSGSGKTTLLNIIGGLDKYDSGDLIIDGISTTDYSDRDWDTYRNHSIGFVFQSYNLIPHQTILSNVEMSMLLSGVGKKERKERAIQALQDVGLGDHIHKKPNQLSGGQMQRVAIARALVNDPEIILADEPTGALDSDTSVQVMEILKEISKRKLVIMVTHNPDLAEEYSTRIIRMKDGVLLDDTDPFDVEREAYAEKPKKKTSMGFFTAISLSFNNLLTKKGRTILTSFAGSIGIIGIALILAISNGVNDYINTIQEETLASYPITLEKEATDMSALMSSMMGMTPEGNGDGTTTKNKEGSVYANPIMYRMMKSMLNTETTTNNLGLFKKHIEKNEEEFNQYINSIQYGYDTKLNIYAKDSKGEYSKADFYELMNNVMGGEEGGIMSSSMSMMESMGNINIWQELMTEPNSNKISSMITEQYDLVYGNWPKEKDEILLVMTENNEISDLTLYALGLVDQSTMMNSTISALTGKGDTEFDEITGKSWTYEDICNIPLKMILPTDYYQYDKESKLWIDISDNKALLNSVIDDGLELKVSGIVKPNPDVMSTSLSGTLCYTKALTDYYIEKINETEMVKYQKKHNDINCITGLPFELDEDDKMTNSKKIKEFKEYVSELTDLEKENLYKEILSTPDEETVEETMDELLKMYDDKNAEEIVDDICKNYASQMGYSEDLIRSMFSGYEKDELIEILRTTVKEMIEKSYETKGEEEIEKIKSQPSESELKQIRDMIYSQIYSGLKGSGIEREMMKKQIQMGYIIQSWSSSTKMSQEAITGYLMTISEKEFENIFYSEVNKAAKSMYEEYKSQIGNDTDNTKKVADDFDRFIAEASDKDLVKYYDNLPDKVSDLSYEDLMKEIGACTFDEPSSINIYPIDFESKEAIATLIDEYNQKNKGKNEIEYTDYMAMLMSSVSNIITAISVVLICFVSISLVVSSIMIGIITYISVLERTKEIGILRSVGASKRDITRVFNAETGIVGFLAGTVGIVTTVILCFPISTIARNITGITTLTAFLPWYGYLLIVLSVILTLIAGLLPSKMAAKKDPVIALRTE